MVNIFISSRYKIDRRQIKKKATQWLYEYGYSPDNVLNIIFIGKNKMKSIANQYKKENVALPVLSFSYKEKIIDPFEKVAGLEKLVGEIYICYPQAILLAAERNKKVDIMLDELIKHGLENIIK